MELEQLKKQELHRIVTTAIIYKTEADGPKFLITRRSLTKKAFPGQWTVPGGGLEVGDYLDTPPNAQGVWYGALETTLRREVEQESGVTIGRPQILLDMTFIRQDDPPTPVLVLSYYAKYEGGEVSLNDESIDSAWVSYDEAKNYDLIAGILEEIEMVTRILAGEDPTKVEYRG